MNASPSPSCRSLPDVVLACLVEAARRVGLDGEAQASIAEQWSATPTLTLNDLPDLCRSLGIAARLPPSSGVEARIHSYPMIRVEGDDALLLVEDLGKGRFRSWDPRTGVETRTNCGPAGSVQLIEVSRAVRFGQSSRGFGFADITHAIDRFWPNTLNILLLSALLQVCAFLGPLFVQFVVDDVIPTFDEHLLSVLLAGFILISVLQHLTEALRTAMIVQFGSSGVYQLMGGVISHLFRLPSQYFEGRAPGDILMRVSAMVSLQDFISRGVVTAFVDGLMAILAVAILAGYSLKLTAVVIVGVGIHAVFTALVQPRSRQLLEQQMALSGAEQTHLIETLNAIRSVKAARAESVREDGWLTIQRRVTHIGVSQIRLQMLSGFAQKVTGSLQHLLVLYFGALAVMNSSMSLGMLFAFLSFRTLFTDRITSLVSQISAYRLMSVNFERVADIVDRPEEDLGGWTPQAAGSGELEVCGVSYSYPGVPVLQDVSLKIGPAQLVGLFGPSGSGKTTLARIILGLVEPDTGWVEIGGVRIQSGAVRQGRSSLGAVLQDEHLFQGSIQENVSFFRRDWDPQLLERALQIAEVLDEIKALPGAVNYKLGPSGSGLSGGQRQRIAIARAVYGGSRTLILDEATSGLDANTSMKILENLRRAGIAALVITHQSALRDILDRSYALSEGRLVPD